MTMNERSTTRDLNKLLIEISKHKSVYLQKDFNVDPSKYNDNTPTDKFLDSLVSN